MIEIICACGCGRKKMVRKADVRRGWGKYYSKSCKAKAQEKRTGQMKAYLRGDVKSRKSTRKPEKRDTAGLDTVFTFSMTRTANLYCSGCGKSIPKSSHVIFDLYEGSMANVYCSRCSKDYEEDAYNDEVHPFSDEAFG